MRHREGGACLVLLLHSATALVSISRPSASAQRQQRVVGSWASAAAPPSFSCFCRRRSSVSETSAAVASPAAAAQRRPLWCRLSRLPTTTPASAASPRCSSTGETRWRCDMPADSRRTALGALRATVASSWAAVEDSASGEGDEKNPTAAAGGEEPGAEALGYREVVAGVSQARRTDGSSPVDEVKLKEQQGPAWTEIVWDEGKGRFVGAKSPLDVTNTQRVRGAVGLLQLLVRHWFVPEDVTPDYYHFTIWRMFQRFVAATVNVFGTQALLLALGIKSRRLGAAAAMSWVLKDALGKCGRILWASKMGRRFDSDAKRWRFRSSLLYAAGNGLEIITYVFPASFLILAAAANSFKQMSMLTSSATRSTIYRSFARGENIGDITAKGEAQIAVVDLLGILSGIGLCTLVGTSRNSILAAYVLLSMVDISAIYLEIRAVVFTILNHERTHLLVRDYVACGSDPVAMAGAPAEAVPIRSPSIVAPRLSDTLPKLAVAVSAAAGGNGQAVKVETSEKVAAVVVVNGRKTEASPMPRAGAEAGARAEDANAERSGNPPLRTVTAAGTVLQSSPSTVSRRENIFMPSRLTTHSFKTWSKVGMDIEDVKDLLDVFGDERYMLAYTEGKAGGKMVRAKRGTVSIILHKEATGIDTVKSMLAREYLIDELARAGFSVVGAHSPSSRLGKQNAINGGCAGVSTRSSTAGEGRVKESGSVTRGGRQQQKQQQQKHNPSRPELLRCLAAARRRANEGAPGFFAALEALGWSTEKFMFGNIQTRVEWTV